MTIIDALAAAALRRDTLQLRSLAQELLREYPRLADVPPPDWQDQRRSIIATGLVELLAERQSQAPPAWCLPVHPLSEPFYFLEFAAHLPRLRAQCDAESPGPLRRRNLFAPGNFLTFV